MTPEAFVKALEFTTRPSLDFGGDKIKASLRITQESYVSDEMYDTAKDTVEVLQHALEHTALLLKREVFRAEVFNQLLERFSTLEESLKGLEVPLNVTEAIVDFRQELVFRLLEASSPISLTEG